MALATLASGLIYLIVRYALQPLRELRERIGSLDDTVDGQRIQLEDPPAELLPVTHELNRLLERVEQAIKRERRLTSNLAHELRTPVAGLLSSLEVTLSRPRNADRYRESAEECFGIAKQMHSLVNNLLSLSRIEAGNVQMQSHVVRLKDSLTEWWSPFEQDAAKKNITVDWIVDSNAKLETDPEFLRVVMNNLFENATCYAPGAIPKFDMAERPSLLR